jgi:uncharacterized membrane protein YhfC
MTKDQKNTVIEYASFLSEEELRWLGLRLTERLSGDLADTLDFMSKNTRMDALLQSANSSTELYDLCDRIKEVVAKECKRKGVILKWTP